MPDSTALLDLIVVIVLSVIAGYVAYWIGYHW
jgi:hypothetical protein